MLRTLFINAILLYGGCCYAQPYLGIQGGAGFVTAFTDPVTVTPQIDVLALGRVSARIYLGGTLGLQQYSFSKELVTPQRAYKTLGTTILNFEQKSTYFFISPRVSWKLSKRSGTYCYLGVGPGFLINGRQSVNSYYYDIHVANHLFSHNLWETERTSNENTSANLNKLVLRTQIGFTESIMQFAKCVITLYQEFNYTPNYVSTGFLKGYNNWRSLRLAPCYISAGIGVNYKYRLKEKR